jgi:ABC-type uncharacterized transport system ATPase subunit
MLTSLTLLALLSSKTQKLSILAGAKCRYSHGKAKWEEGAKKTKFEKKVAMAEQGICRDFKTGTCERGITCVIVCVRVRV